MSEEISKYEVFNKYEEAKKLLLIDYDINKDKRYLVAIEALEKQIARKVVNKCSTFTMAECPHCNGTVNFPNKHCHWCGQKIDWEAE